MAQVTYGTPAPQRHVIGDIIERFYVINGPSGSTMPTGVQDLLWIDAQSFPQGGGASVITSITVSAGVATFTTSGTMVNEVIQVVGRVG